MKPLYRIENLKKNHARKPILDIAQLEIFQGEILGLVGANGSGKSTLLRHLAFLENPESGMITYRDIPSVELSLEIKREISLLLPEPHLLRRSVKENLLYGYRMQHRKTFEDSRATRQAAEALELVGLRPEKFLERAWHELSSGEKQRISLAARLILRPKTLLLDEPTSNLDLSGLPQLSQAIEYANATWGATVVIASHDPIWLSALAHRQIGLHFGRVMETSSASNLLLENWEQRDGWWIYTFSDGQILSLPLEKKIGKKRGVTINPRSLRLSKTHDAKQNPGEIILRGCVTSISFLPKSQEVSIRLRLGVQELECIQTLADFLANPAYPTQSLFILFEGAHLQTSWHTAPQGPSPCF